MASELYKKIAPEEISLYFKNKQNIDKEKLKNSSTLYIGNLSYKTSETQLYQLFSFCGKIKRIIMGLNKFTGAQCGFAFVEYLNKKSADIAKKTLMGTILDGKEIRVDLDIGFEDGRQYGRGKNGYQKRDEMRKTFDPDRPWDKKNNNYNNRENNGNFRNNNREYNNNRDYNNRGYNNRDNNNREYNNNRYYNNRGYNNRDNNNRGFNNYNGKGRERSRNKEINSN